MSPELRMLLHPRTYELSGYQRIQPLNFNLLIKDYPNSEDLLSKVTGFGLSKISTHTRVSPSFRQSDVCLLAWAYDITSSVTQRCFRKSTIIESVQSLPAQAEADLSISFKPLSKLIIFNKLFLNPIDEKEAPYEEDALPEIIQEHTNEQDNEEAELKDVEPQAQVIPTTTKALLANQTTMRYQEYRDETQREDVRFLEELERPH
jgi:hypothetical protein